MCGISGLVEKNAGSCHAETLRRMNRAVAHRGPDHDGEEFWKNVALGHRRLAILDPRPCGHQPMASEDRSCVIVFNGEIYNHRELRQELEDGYAFRTQTDTETIIASYLRWGVECVSRFNGMWAFSILDKKKNRVFCSRDRFGIKPFYYVDTPDRFAFGSEIRQLLPLLSSIRSVGESVTDFLLTSVCDHTQKTFFEKVLRLQPGHNLIYDLRHQKASFQPYYTIPRPGFSYDRSTPEDVAQHLGSLLESSVHFRLRSDVPVGTCLSGGLDSSSIAILASRRYRQETGQAFGALTAVSEDPSNDESRFARAVSEAGGMRWIPTKPDYEKFLQALPLVVRTQEEPFGGASMIMQYFVMKAAREQGIPVLLDGQGGDETLLGYPKYFGQQLAVAWKKEGPLGFFFGLRSAIRNHSNITPLSALKHLVGSLSAPWRHRFYTWRHGYLRKPQALPSHLRKYSQASGDTFRLQEVEIFQTNLPALLRYEDRNSMAHAIETRLPFLDHRFVEAALALPDNLKIRDGWSKWVLRKTMEKQLPPQVVWRKDKIGFEAPENLWFKKHAPKMRATVLGSPLLQGLAQSDRLREAWHWLDGRSRWRLYSVALWENEFAVSG